MRELETSRDYARKLRRQLTDAEAILWVKLREMRQIGHRFRRQHSIGLYIADFACIQAKLVIELDGETHGSEEARAYDQRRDAYMQARGWTVLRFSNVEVYRNLNGVLDGIEHALTADFPPKRAR